ncbi:unnamed protein product, partial [Rotaria sordida]
VLGPCIKHYSKYQFILFYENTNFRQYKLLGNITVEIFLSDFITLINYNKGFKLDVSLCDQAFVTARRCTKKKSFARTSVIDL